jgi:hypothetical protein
MTATVPQYTPMIPTLVPKPFHRDGWVYEEKVDGYRMLAFKDGDRVRRAATAWITRSSSSTSRRRSLLLVPTLFKPHGVARKMWPDGDTRLKINLILDLVRGDDLTTHRAATSPAARTPTPRSIGCGHGTCPGRGVAVTRELNLELLLVLGHG